MEANYDDILAAAQQQGEQGFDVDAWAEKKQSERDEVYALRDRMTDEVSMDGDKFQQYLDTQSRFRKYSVGNVLLIMAQKPQATRLKDFDGWKENRVSIRRNEKGIRILEPGDEYQREDGTWGTSYNVKKVFDISQTKAKKQPARPKPEERNVMVALVSRTPLPLQSVEQLVDSSMGARFDETQNKIFVKKGMSGEDIFRSVTQELAHAELAMGMGQGEYTREDNAFRAYCVSYMLSKQYGFSTKQFSFKELPGGFAEAQSQDVREELGVIRDVAENISGRMSRILNQERSQKEMEQAR